MKRWAGCTVERGPGGDLWWLVQACKAGGLLTPACRLLPPPRAPQARCRARWSATAAPRLRGPRPRATARRRPSSPPASGLSRLRAPPWARPPARRRRRLAPPPPPSAATRPRRRRQPRRRRPAPCTPTPPSRCPRSWRGWRWGRSSAPARLAAVGVLLWFGAGVRRGACGPARAARAPPPAVLTRGHPTLHALALLLFVLPPCSLPRRVGAARRGGGEDRRVRAGVGGRRGGAGRGAALEAPRPPLHRQGGRGGGLRGGGAGWGRRTARPWGRGQLLHAGSAPGQPHRRFSSAVNACPHLPAAPHPPFPARRPTTLR